jgi:hypothetical protein
MSANNNEELKKIISKIIKEELDNLKKEIIKDFSDKVESILESQTQSDPYKKLTKYSQEAMNQVKKDLTNAMEAGNEREIAEAKKKADKIDNMIDEVVHLIEKIKKDEEGRIEFDNPLYPTKRLYRFFPAVLRWKSHERGARNWLGFLVTGTGLIIMSRGIWDASGELLSIQGSIIIGAIMVALMAWLERKKIFEVFGQE